MNKHPGDPGSNSSPHTLSGRRPEWLQSAPGPQETLELTRIRSSHHSRNREPSPAYSTIERGFPRGVRHNPTHGSKQSHQRTAWLATGGAISPVATRTVASTRSAASTETEKTSSSKSIKTASTTSSQRKRAQLAAKLRHEIGMTPLLPLPLFYWES